MLMGDLGPRRDAGHLRGPVLVGEPQPSGPDEGSRADDQGSWNAKGMPEAVCATCCTKLAPKVLDVRLGKPAPSRKVTGPSRRIEAVGKRDAHEVAQQVTVVEVVPNHHFDLQVCPYQEAVKPKVERVLDTLVIENSPTSLVLYPAHAMESDRRLGLAASGGLKEILDTIPSVFSRVQVRVDQVE